MIVEEIEKDIIIVGAGISGISMAYFIQKNCPNKSYVILEGRERVGGTWDLFQYPGIRSDSDMYTFGYSFHPWIRDKSISEGKFIVDYLRSAIETYHIDDKIRFQQLVKNASWSSEIGQWNLEVMDNSTSSTVKYRAQFMFLCTGYYNYESGYDPDFPGKERFKGLIVHPQKWPSDLNYANQNVVIIGSGATAVTLLPNLAKTANHVTMLQRSPTYISSIPSETSDFNKFLYRLLPQYWAFTIIRWGRILSGLKLYWLARTFPKETVKSVHDGIRKFLGPNYDIQKHFTPSYAPWDQRYCVCPDGDFFNAIASNKGSIVTDTIETFTENGILTKSGEMLPADIIVTATGLKLLAVGGIQLNVDGKCVDLSSTIMYKGVMLSGIPNFSWTVGYTNASYTLKSDLTAQYMSRLVNYMDSRHYQSCVPILSPHIKPEKNLISALTSGYVQRGCVGWPKQASVAPWTLTNNYLKDYWMLNFQSLNDKNLKFKSLGEKV